MPSGLAHLIQRATAKSLAFDVSASVCGTGSVGGISELEPRTMCAARSWERRVP
jgi:hypothetical protein